jgi:hypothetical protein
MKSTVVTINGKARKLTGEATVGQRILLHHLTGENTRNLKISKADASKKIAEMTSKKTAKDGKVAKKLVGDATVSQKVLLHFLTGKDTHDWKLSKQEASEMIAELKSK